jgi:hypothetical protein
MHLAEGMFCRSCTEVEYDQLPQSIAAQQAASLDEQPLEPLDGCEC